MPQPTLGDVHVNRPLTNISVAYSQEAAGVEFVAGRAFPAIPVENKSDLYWTNSDSPLSPDRDATIFLTNKALVRRENQWASRYFTTGVWTGLAAGAGAASASFSNNCQVVYWDYVTSTPITDIRHAKTLARPFGSSCVSRTSRHHRATATPSRSTALFMTCWRSRRTPKAAPF